MSDPTPDIEALVRERTRKAAGIAALRKAVRLARSFEAEEEFRRRASRTVILLLCALALGVLVLSLALPGALTALFRALS